MANRFRRVFVNFDWWLTVAAASISGFGLLLLYDLSQGQGLFFRQLVFFLFGLAVYFGAQILDRNFWRNFSVVFYLAVLFLLVFLLLFGDVTRGVRGWLNFGLFSLQASELAKIAVILFLAAVLERLKFSLWNWRHVFLVLLIIGLPAGLVILQPDFGSALILIIAGMLMVIYASLPPRAFLALAGLGFIILAFGWAVLRPYQRERIITFIRPEADLSGAGYNVRQSLVAIGSGGFAGRGLGLGTQSQLNFLPAKETDFIFASLAEELGFLGAFLLFILYVALFWRLSLALRAGRDLFANFLLLGIFGALLSQVVINIGMNLALLPVTGVPLPLVSYGGSSMLVSWFALAMAQSARKDW